MLTGHYNFGHIFLFTIQRLVQEYIIQEYYRSSCHSLLVEWLEKCTLVGQRLMYSFLFNFFLCSASDKSLMNNVAMSSAAL